YISRYIIRKSSARARSISEATPTPAPRVEFSRRRVIMERKKASDFPQEVLNLFDKFVHGDIDRRAFLDGASKFVTAGGMTAVAMLEALRPNFAWAQQVPKDDPRIKVEIATAPSPQGNGNIKGPLVRPANATGKLPAILVVHENRGLSPYIEDVARRLG